MYQSLSLWWHFFLQPGLQVTAFGETASFNHSHVLLVFSYFFLLLNYRFTNFHFLGWKKKSCLFSIDDLVALCFLYFLKCLLPFFLKKKILPWWAVPEWANVIPTIINTQHKYLVSSGCSTAITKILMQAALLASRNAFVSWMPQLWRWLHCQQSLCCCQNTGEKLYFKKRKTNVSIDDDRTVVGQTVKLILSSRLGDFFS